MTTVKRDPPAKPGCDSVYVVSGGRFEGDPNLGFEFGDEATPFPIRAGGEVVAEIHGCRPVAKCANDILSLGSAMTPSCWQWTAEAAELATWRHTRAGSHGARRPTRTSTRTGCGAGCLCVHRDGVGPADSWLPGQYRTHEARCSAEGTRSPGRLEMIVAEALHLDPRD